MPQMTQDERLIARIKQLCRAHPAQAIHLTVVVNESGEPLLWFSEEPRKIEGLIVKMETKSDHTELLR